MKERARMKKFDRSVIEAIYSVATPIDENMISKEYDFEVVTPMFGGGVEAGINDDSKLIRETEIRGHLRFWWRATVGATCAESKELFARESDVWGNTQMPSKVVVRILKIAAGTKRNSIERESFVRQGRRRTIETFFGSRTLGYAFFPFVENQKKAENDYIKDWKRVHQTDWPAGQAVPDNVVPKNAKAEENIKFRLQVIYPSNHENDVQTALWAWANFGGVGARTRRGCGALYCKEFAPSLDEQGVLQNDANGVHKYFEDYFPRTHGRGSQWPILDKLLINGSIADPMTSWNKIIEAFRYFRQGEGGRTWISGKPKKSKWPEPDAIRSKTNTSLPGHKPTGTPVIAMPRAEFGMPIIFKFKDGPGRDQRGEGPDQRGKDPGTRTLTPIEKERMASPLILKPLLLSKDKAVPCALFLRVPKIDKVVLTPNFNSGTSLIFDVHTSGYGNNSPLQKSGTGSALESFCLFLTGALSLVGGSTEEQHQGYKTI